VLVLGGGDGKAVREVLKHPGVQQVTLVELDPHMTRLFAQDARLVALNGGALADARLRIVNADAYTWLESSAEFFDVVIIDFPDPTNFSLGKLYSTSFYVRVDEHLAAGGFMVVQTTSPLVARKSFWTVAATLEAVGLRTTPYHAHVPSFGEWGFVIAGRRPWNPPAALPAGLRFLTVEGLPALLQFPPDMARVPAEPNRLSNQVLVSTFEEEWGRVSR
jgi:spermidine synthase